MSFDTRDCRRFGIDAQSAVWSCRRFTRRPRTIIEALSSGRPVIVRSVGCRDAIQDGSEGLVVPRGDSTKLAEAITDLANDPVRMRAMGRARKTALERYGEAA